MTTHVPLAERKRRQVRQRIIETAEELFLARGFDDVSVSDIADRAEVGRTTFFRYFGDKVEVVFAQEQELLDTIDAASGTSGVPVPRSAAEALGQLCPIVLALCAQAAADTEAYTRHYQLIGQHPELRAREAAKMQDLAGRAADLLVQRGCDRPTAVFAAQIALACFQTAKRLGSDPRTLEEDTRAAFGRALTLAPPPSP